MIVLHTGDIHLGDLPGPIHNGKNGRREDTLNCMLDIVRKARQERPQLSIIAGDIFHRSRTWCDTALEDVRDAVDIFLRPLCSASEHVFLLLGTPNHDNPLAFEVLRQSTQDVHNLHICTAPGVYTLAASGGEAQILGIPAFDQGRLKAFCPGMGKEAENRTATALINDVLLGLSLKLDKSKPSILVAHYTVAGSENESGSTFLAGQDVVLLPQSIDASSVALACLGHIHKPQRVKACKTPTYYCGSPNQITFNDEGIGHGIWKHGLCKNGGEWFCESAFLPTPERRHMTIRFGPGDIARFIEAGRGAPLLEQGPGAPGIDGLIVRVRYRATAEQEKALNKAELQKSLMDAGAFHVAEIIAEGQGTAATANEMPTDGAPTAALRQYLKSLATTGHMSAADTDRLEGLAAPLIRMADDGREANRHTGAFMPLRIQARNYRSYANADFDFADIRMAMVNGQNGAGKSSLFMDAIADALFEDGREGQIGGWLRDGEKSGSVTFEFSMGGEGYRVARTRARSGKGTLAFSRRAASGGWEDCGDSTMKLTQAGIEQTLGMDAGTFCTIALIRQDAYGLFLEAGSGRRMEVLSSLLGLGVYARLESLAKEAASGKRRLMEQAKDRMAALSVQIAAKGQLEAADHALREAIEGAAADLLAADGQIAAAQREEALRLEVARQASSKEAEARGLMREANDKEAILAGLRREKADASNLADMKQAAETAAEAIMAARGELEAIAPFEAEHRALAERLSSLLGASANIRNGLETNAAARGAHRSLLGRREEIEGAAKALEEISEARVKLDERAARHAEAWQAANASEAARRAFVSESRARIGELEAQIKTAQGKAALLKSSGCPVPDKATCGFLRDARSAENGLAALQDSIRKMKYGDRAEYDRISAEAEAAQAALAAIKDPKAERDGLAIREARTRPIAALVPKLEAAAAAIAEMDKQDAQQHETLKATEAAIEGATARMPELEQKASRATELRGDIRKNEPAASLLARCAAAQATADALDGRIGALQADIAAARQKAADASLEAEGIRCRIPAGASELAALAARRRAISEKQNASIAERGGIKARLEAAADAQRQHGKYAMDAKTLARGLSDYQALARAFGTDGIQHMVIRSAVPEIMHRANEILAAMTGGRMAVDFRTEREQKGNAKIVNSLDVWITGLSGGSRPYSSHSGGEKVKVALAVTLGLADVKARRAGVQLGMLQIDEPPFLDSDGAEAYADALLNMSMRNPGMKILAISHDPSMKARFPQNITVQYGENGSVILQEKD